MPQKPLDHFDAPNPKRNPLILAILLALMITALSFVFFVFV